MKSGFRLLEVVKNFSIFLSCLPTILSIWHIRSLSPPLSPRSSHPHTTFIYITGQTDATSKGAARKGCSYMLGRRVYY